MKKFKILNEKLSFSGVVLDFFTRRVELPNGNEADWDLVKHKGAASVIPVKEDGTIIMVSQYRGGSDSIMLEIPAGAKNSIDEDAKECALRELEEETGYRTEPEDMHHLIDYHSAPAYTSELVSIFYTEKLIPSKQNLDENEFVELSCHTLDELIAMIEEGAITDGKTIAALFAYKNIMDKR